MAPGAAVCCRLAAECARQIRDALGDGGAGADEEILILLSRRMHLRAVYGSVSKENLEMKTCRAWPSFHEGTHDSFSRDRRRAFESGRSTPRKAGASTGSSAKQSKQPKK
jgi:hypothetical protein